MRIRGALGYWYGTGMTTVAWLDWTCLRKTRDDSRQRANYCDIQGRRVRSVL